MNERMNELINCSSKEVHTEKKQKYCYTSIEGGLWAIFFNETINKGAVILERYGSIECNNNIYEYINWRKNE